MDWGCVSQLNVAMAIWGAMSAAEIDLWDRPFRRTSRDCSATRSLTRAGRRWTPPHCKRQVTLYALLMGVTWLMDVPALIRAKVPARAAIRRTDPAIKGDESVRAPLQMLTNVLNLWEHTDMGEVLRGL